MSATTDIDFLLITAILHYAISRPNRTSEGPVAWRVEVMRNPTRGWVFGLTLEWTSEAHGIYFYFATVFGFIGKSL